MAKKKVTEEVIETFSIEDFKKELNEIIEDNEKLKKSIESLYNKKVIPELGGALTYTSLLEKLLKTI